VLDVAADRVLDDIALAADIGLQSIRLDVPWAAAQPRAGAIDGDVFERVHGAAQAARAAGLEVWFRLLQPSIPHWFEDEGGFLDERKAGVFWPRWVELAADQLGELASGWVPFEAPFGLCNRMMPADPRRHGELVHTMVVAWRDAWRILHGHLPVATSLDVAIERATDDTPEAREAAWRRDQLRRGVWFQGFTDGVVRIPGRSEKPLADLAGAVDVIGLALRHDVEVCLHRAAEFPLDRPFAVTYKPVGDTDAARAQHAAAMWREVHRATDDLPIAHVTVTPFVDAPGNPGIVTQDRELKDSGHVFTTA
jgi:hypothetical protein